MAGGAGNLIPLVAAIIGLGVGAQILSDRFEVPSIIFLIGAGIALGPEGLGLVTRTSFGNALPAIVGLSVAIIVFEGAFHLRAEKLRQAPAENIRLVTVGAFIALVATSAVTKFAFDAPWDVSFLIGALLVATGPTVITPILEVVPVRDRVEAALETEGIVNDVTAAIIAVVVFEIIVAGDTNPEEFLVLFAERLGIGVFVGILVAAVVWYLLRYVDLSPGNAPQNARLLVLAGALVAFGTADFIAKEAGVAAVATAGIILGNLDVPYEEDISEFKGDVTLVVLSFVFIALAALLRFEDLLELGVAGIVLVVAVALVIRPALVFLSLMGDRFTRSEKVFMSLVGPRGIIPASVATLFAVELQNRATELRTEAADLAGGTATAANVCTTNPTGEVAGLCAQAAQLDSGATLLVGTVFLVILATVVFEGGFARRLAKTLDVIPMRVLVIGGGQVGRSLAERLEDRGENVVIIEDDETQVEVARNGGHTVHIGDGTDTEVLRAAGADNARIVVAATGDDDVNLLVAQLASSKFDVETILARANNPDNVEAFEDLGVRTISSALATAQAIDNAIERPALADWMSKVGEAGDVQEIEVTSEELVGRTVREVGPELPGGCLIAVVARDGETKVPEADFTFEYGDRITVIGQHDSVREAMDFCHPGER
ncbi:cation:proton antiporter domain-containing protein [Halorarius halobius]|uniref:cation:proton antiporter domain-containing protein n=1 Tax=Halorarius halobius TaxID=2962671 RepID=UPI0020CE27B0|nr:cation:proton antiporter [Halorarius halobius]